MEKYRNHFVLSQCSRRYLLQPITLHAQCSAVQCKCRIHGHCWARDSFPFRLIFPLLTGILQLLSLCDYLGLDMTFYWTARDPVLLRLLWDEIFLLFLRLYGINSHNWRPQWEIHRDAMEEEIARKLWFKSPHYFWPIYCGFHFPIRATVRNCSFASVQMTPRPDQTRVGTTLN